MGEGEKELEDVLKKRKVDDAGRNVLRLGRDASRGGKKKKNRKEEKKDK